MQSKKKKNRIKAHTKRLHTKTMRGKICQHFCSKHVRCIFSMFAYTHKQLYICKCSAKLTQISFRSKIIRISRKKNGGIKKLSPLTFTHTTLTINHRLKQRKIRAYKITTLPKEIHATKANYLAHNQRIDWSTNGTHQIKERAKEKDSSNDTL